MERSNNSSLQVRAKEGIGLCHPQSPINQITTVGSGRSKEEQEENSKEEWAMVSAVPMGMGVLLGAPGHCPVSLASP